MSGASHFRKPAHANFGASRWPHVVAGLYRITCLETGGFYIGSSTNVRKRWSVQRYRLKHNRQTNPKLQEAWNTFGPSAFEFTLLAQLEPTELLDTETRLLQRLVGTAGCYNVGRVANAAMTGLKRPRDEAWREQCRQRSRNRTPEHRANLSASLRRHYEQRKNPPWP